MMMGNQTIQLAHLFMDRFNLLSSPILSVFGGVKLGPGGLVTAYKAAAKGALEQAKIITTEIKDHYTLEFPYTKMHSVIRIVQSEKGTILEQVIENNCKMKISLSQSKSKSFEEKVAESRICHFKKIADID
jgi:putative IMPACT (imprinted ancient) family translation regulator